MRRPRAGRQMATSSVPLTIALAAGGLSVVNPCGFPLLPAFLSFYLAADEEQLPRARTRALQGIVVGGFVTVGFLGLFAIVGLPVTYGAGAFARAYGDLTGTDAAQSSAFQRPRLASPNHRGCGRFRAYHRQCWRTQSIATEVITQFTASRCRRYRW